MFIRWQRSEIRKISGGWYYNNGILTRVIGYGANPWCTYPRNRYDYGCKLKDGRIIRDRRLKAIVCESKRVDGKPKQSHIAFLGSIEESWLPSFFDDIPNDEAERMKVHDWHYHSTVQRIHF